MSVCVQTREKFQLFTSMTLSFLFKYSACFILILPISEMFVERDFMLCQVTEFNP